MPKDNNPTVARSHEVSLFEKLVEISTFGAVEAPVHYTTTVTGSDGTSATGHGSSQAEADKNAGDTYQSK